MGSWSFAYFRSYPIAMDGPIYFSTGSPGTGTPQYHLLDGSNALNLVPHGTYVPNFILNFWYLMIHSQGP